jgi:hypothetical protein
MQIFHTTPFSANLCLILLPTLGSLDSSIPQLTQIHSLWRQQNWCQIRLLVPMKLFTVSLSFISKVGSLMVLRELVTENSIKLKRSLRNLGSTVFSGFPLLCPSFLQLQGKTRVDGRKFKGHWFCLNSKMNLYGWLSHEAVHPCHWSDEV